MTQQEIQVALARNKFEQIGKLSLDLLKEREREGKKDSKWEDLIKINNAAHEGYDHLKK
jgi:hypothetical protein